MYFAGLERIKLRRAYAIKIRNRSTKHKMLLTPIPQTLKQAKKVNTKVNNLNSIALTKKSLKWKRDECLVFFLIFTKHFILQKKNKAFFLK